MNFYKRNRLFEEKNQGLAAKIPQILEREEKSDLAERYGLLISDKDIKFDEVPPLDETTIRIFSKTKIKPVETIKSVKHLIPKAKDLDLKLNSPYDLIMYNTLNLFHDKLSPSLFSFISAFMYTSEEFLGKQRKFEKKDAGHQQVKYFLENKVEKIKRHLQESNIYRDKIINIILRPPTTRTKYFAIFQSPSQSKIYKFNTDLNGQELEYKVRTLFQTEGIFPIYSTMERIIENSPNKNYSTISIPVGR